VLVLAGRRARRLQRPLSAQRKKKRRQSSTVELFESDITLFGLAMLGLVATTVAILRDHRSIARSISAKAREAVSQR
jgi:hypothetical protein